MRRGHQIPCIDPGAGACEVSPPAAGGCSPTSTQVLFLRSRCDRPFYPFTPLGFQLAVLLSVSAAVALRLTKTLIPPQINRPFGRQGRWMGEELEVGGGGTKQSESPLWEKPEGPSRHVDLLLESKDLC